jgi:hypothetical protein
MVQRKTTAKPAKVAETPRRRRGRPPKSEARTVVVEPTVKRGPGRPRKVQAVAAPSPKRRRGRPPKLVSKPAPVAQPTSAKALTSDELRRELGSLRSSFKQTIEQFELRLGGQLVELGGALDSLGKKGTRPALSSRSIKKMIAAIHATKLKPAKGRLKDLERIHELVRELLALVPEQP